MFRVTLVKTQIVADEIHHHVRLYRDGTDQICGVLQLQQTDWELFLMLAAREGFAIDLNSEDV